MRKRENMTKAELLLRLKALEQRAPDAHIIFQHERLLHELQVQHTELEAQNLELREAQQVIEVARDRYADLYDFAPVGYVTFDDKGVIRETNLAAAGMLGLERTRLVGVPFHLHLVREDLARFHEHLRSLSEQRAATELHLARKSAAPLPVLMQSVLVYDAEKKGFLCRSTLTDITDRKQAELVVQEKEARLRAVLETAVDGIITIDERGRIESFNQAAESLFGYPAEEVLGQNISRLMPSPYREEHDRYLENYQTTGRRKIIGIGREVSGQRKDGSTFPLELSVSEVRVAGRRLFTGFVRDITPRKKAEEAMREESHFLSAVLETAGALVIVLDEAGHVVRFNQACEQVSGFTEQEMMGKTIWDLLLPPEEVGAVRAVFEQLRSGHFPSQFQNHWLTKTGQRRLISWANTVLTRRDGTVKHIIGTGLDITERKRDELRRHLQYETGRVLAASDSLAEAVPKLLQAVAVALGWDVGEFWETDFRSKKLRVLHVWHAPGRKLNAFVKHSLKLSISMFDGLPGRVLSTRQPDWIPNISECPHFNRSRAAARAGLHSALAFPISLHEHSLGVMAFLTHRMTEPDEDLLQMFASLGSQIGQFIERKRAEEALHDANEFGKQVINGAQAGIIVYGRAGRIVVWNPFMEEITGYCSEEVLGRPAVEMFPFLQEQHFEKMLERALAGEIFDAPDIPFDLPEKGKRGWTAARFAPLRDARQEIVGIIVAVRDITERKQLENEVLELSEREQRKFGQDLHDGLGQRLTGLEMLSHALAEELKSHAPALAKQARRLNHELRETVTQARLISHSLAPVPLEGDGLRRGLAELAASTSRIPGVTCRFTCDSRVSIQDVAVATHLYRIAQEAVNNALKHGHATKVKITLTGRADELELSVENNGRVIPPAHRKKGGTGLNVMRYRAEVIGARLSIQSGKRQGVKVICTLRRKK